MALIDRDPGSTLARIEAARDKAYRAPMLMLGVVRLSSEREPVIPNHERLVSAGCAIQNLLLAAASMGYGSGLTSGQAVSSDRLRTLFGLKSDEQVVCFVNVGTVVDPIPRRVRPDVTQIVSLL